MRFVGTLEIAFELKIVGRIREDEIDGCGLQFRHFGDAVADNDVDVGSRLKFSAGRLCRRPATRHYHDSNSDSGDAVGDAGLNKPTAHTLTGQSKNRLNRENFSQTLLRVRLRAF